MSVPGGYSDQALAGKVDHVQCETVEAAVAAAARDAAAADAPEPVVLFSPACASFDQFTDYAARGDTFRSLVQSTLEEGAPS